MNNPSSFSSNVCKLRCKLSIGGTAATCLCKKQTSEVRSLLFNVKLKTNTSDQVYVTLLKQSRYHALYKTFCSVGASSLGVLKQRLALSNYNFEEVCLGKMLECGDVGKSGNRSGDVVCSKEGDDGNLSETSIVEFPRSLDCQSLLTNA